MKTPVIQAFLQVFRWVKIRPRASAAAALLVAGLALFFLIRDGNGGAETLVIEPTDFVGQVTVVGTVVSPRAVDLGFTQSGRIAFVYARPGDAVASGRTLANIENGDIRALLLQKQAALDMQRAKLVSLEQGTRPEQVAVTESSVAAARATLEQADRALMDSLEDAYFVAEDAVRSKADQFFSNPDTSSPKLTISVGSSQQEIDLESGRAAAGALLARWKERLSATAPGNISAAEETRQALSSISSFVSKASVALQGATPNPSVSQADIDGFVSDIAAARGSVSDASSALTSAVTVRKKEEAALTTAEKNLALAKAGATGADLDAQRAQVKAAEADVMAAEAQLLQTLIWAPFAGIVTRVAIEPGEIISPNASALSMISTGAFQIESFVPEVNISDLETGNMATATLDAYGSELEFGAIVVSIEPAETVRDGVSTYKTILQFKNPDPRIRSGMTANVMIETARKQGAIVVPKGALIQKNGKTTATVLVQGDTAELEVRTGSESLGLVEIVQGLAPGDMLVLNP